VSEERILAITKIVLNLMSGMASRVHRSLKVIAINANGIGRQRYELSKQLQDLHVDVALLRDISNLTRGSIFQILTSIEFITTREYVDLHPLISIEATGVCIPIGNNEILIAAVYRSPGRAWSDADTTGLLSFRKKSILAGDMNAKHSFWNSRVSNPSGEKLLNLFDLDDFDISVP
jgi:hypothetical protein